MRTVTGAVCFAAIFGGGCGIWDVREYPPSVVPPDVATLQSAPALRRTSDAPAITPVQLRVGERAIYVVYLVDAPPIEEDAIAYHLRGSSAPLLRVVSPEGRTLTLRSWERDVIAPFFFGSISFQEASLNRLRSSEPLAWFEAGYRTDHDTPPGRYTLQMTPRTDGWSERATIDTAVHEFDAVVAPRDVDD